MALAAHSLSRLLRPRQLSRLLYRPRELTYLASIDQGTSSSRVVLYDAATLAPVASHQVELQSATTNPRPGWSQMDAKAIVKSVDDAAAGALQKAGATAADVAGVGITNQRESTVVWDARTGEPLYDCVLWHDARTRGTAASIKASVGGADALRPTCGLPVSTYFSGVKLKWLLDEVPAVKDAVEAGYARVGTVDSWLVWNLTNGATHATDFTNASRTMLMDLGKGAWDPSSIDALGLSSLQGALPEIRSSAEDYGTIQTGSLSGAKLTGVLGDQMAAMVGQRCFAVGDAKITYGTGAFMLVHAGNTPAPSSNGLLSTALYDFKGEKTYALEGAVACCAVGINWFRDSLGLFETSPEISDLAASVDSSEGCYFVSAFGGLLAPRWRDDARAALVGLTLAHDRRHVSRAVLEGVAFQAVEVLDAMVEDTGRGLGALRVDGGVAQSDVMLQIQADLAAVPVERPADVETTAAGAAVAAGLGCGVFDGISDVAAGTAPPATFSPKLPAADRDAKLASWRAAVDATYGWADRA
mmetsp:Transcript_5644/g.17607  ORF Transcript_5644/g.17607 Transcript_5644/m.17607 type:complete len:529 (+) Transcript_5644:583-2169(+)